MLSLDPKDLAGEIDNSIEFRAKHLAPLERIEQRLAGNWFRSDLTTEPNPENQLFAYVAFMLPELFYEAAPGRWTTKRPTDYQTVADAIDAFMEHWVRETNWPAELRAIGFDAITGHGVCRVGMEKVANAGAKSTLRPYACRVPRRHFLIDPACEIWQDARFMGHEYFRDLADAQADPMMDASALDGAETFAAPKPFGQSASRKTDTDRKMVRLVDLWLPEHGQICTLVMQDKSAAPKFAKPPTDFWGPKDMGPYEIFGCYIHPGDPIPYGAIQGIMEQFIEVNSHLTAAAREAATAKLFWLVEGNSPDTANAMVNAVSGGVYVVKGLGNNVQKVETGTMSNQRLEYTQTARERLDRIIGLGDAQRGRASGATATESTIVQSSVDLRTEWMRSRVIESVANVLRRVAWYAVHDESIVMNVSRRDVATGALVEGIFLGGLQPGQEDLDFSDFNITLDPDSMKRSDDAADQQRWLQLIQVLPTVTQLMPMMPGISWVIDQFGDTMNIPKMSERLFGQQGQAPMGMGQPPMGAGGQPAGLPQPQGIPPVNANLPAQAPMG